MEAERNPKPSRVGPAGLPQNVAPTKREPGGSAAGRANQAKAQLLHYDPTPAPRHLTRRLLILIAAATVIAIGCAILPTLYRRLVLIHLEHLAFAPTLFPETVVFDTRSSSMPTLKRSDPGFVSGTLGKKNYVAYLPSAWVRFASRVTSWKGSKALIFAGPVQDSSGNTHLVSIEAFDWYVNSSALVIATKEYSLGGLRAEPREMLRYTDYPEIHVWSNTVVHAGRVDPEHPDRVLFDVIQSGHRQTWTIELHNNQFTCDHHDDSARFDPDGPRGTLDGVNQAPLSSPASFR